MLESDIQKACLEYLEQRGIYCWRNNTTGIYNKKTGGYFFHGLAGVSDILGIIKKTKDGRTGVFLAIEVKRPKGKVSDAQNAFLDHICDNGGIAMVVHSVDELEEDLKEIL